MQLRQGGREAAGENGLVMYSDGALLPAADPVLPLCLRGEHQDRDVSGSLVREQVAEDAVAVHQREHQVQDDGVGHVGHGQGQPLLAVGGLQDLVAGMLEVHPAEQEHIRFVVDDEDPGHRPSPLLPRRRLGSGCSLSFSADKGMVWIPGTGELRGAASPQGSALTGPACPP